MVVLPPWLACLLLIHSSARSLSCPCVRSNKRARVMCSKGTSSAFSLSVCEKVSSSVRGLTESKLHRIEECVSVKTERESSAI